jgi:hypothetical protein
MKSTAKTMHTHKFLAFKEANISKVEGLQQLLCSFTKRITVSYSSSPARCRPTAELCAMSACFMAVYPRAWKQMKSLKSALKPEKYFLKMLKGRLSYFGQR